MTVVVGNGVDVTNDVRLIGNGMIEVEVDIIEVRMLDRVVEVSGMMVGNVTVPSLFQNVHI